MRVAVPPPGVGQLGPGGPARTEVVPRRRVRGSGPRPGPVYRPGNGDAGPDQPDRDPLVLERGLRCRDGDEPQGGGFGCGAERAVIGVSQGRAVGRVAARWSRGLTAAGGPQDLAGDQEVGVGADDVGVGRPPGVDVGRDLGVGGAAARPAEQRVGGDVPQAVAADDDAPTGGGRDGGAVVSAPVGQSGTGAGSSRGGPVRGRVAGAAAEPRSERGGAAIAGDPGPGRAGRRRCAEPREEATRSARPRRRALCPARRRPRSAPGRVRPRPRRPRRAGRRGRDQDVGALRRPSAAPWRGVAAIAGNGGSARRGPRRSRPCPRL